MAGTKAAIAAVPPKKANNCLRVNLDMKLSLPFVFSHQEYTDCMLILGNLLFKIK